MEDFHFDYSDPHPGKMGEIYDDQPYHIMSPIRYGDDNTGIPLCDISDLPPLDLSRERIHLPELLASWGKKLLRPFTPRKIDKGKSPEGSNEGSGSSEQSSLNSPPLKKSPSFGDKWKNVTKPFRRKSASNSGSDDGSA